jgi:hypothetical protein
VSEDATVNRVLKIEWYGVGMWASVRVCARVNCENEMREKVTTDGCVGSDRVMMRVRVKVGSDRVMMRVRVKVTTDGCVWLKELGVCDVHSPHFLLHHWWFQLDLGDDERRAWVVVPPVTSAVHWSQQPDASG